MEGITMAMAKLQLYKNEYIYPDYGGITKYSSEKNCTPVGMGLKTGTIRVEGTMKDFLSCNYLRITRNDKKIYGWIEDVEYLNDLIYNVSYSIDPFRTYKNNITVGHQFVERDNDTSTKKDDMLSSNQGYPEIYRSTFYSDDSASRFLVVQVRAGQKDGPADANPSFSDTPASPTPYDFFVKKYDKNKWFDDPDIAHLLNTLGGITEDNNIVTMYSVPYLNLDYTKKSRFYIKDGNGEKIGEIGNFRVVKGSEGDDMGELVREIIDVKFPEELALDDLPLTNHQVQIVIPDAGIMNVPTELAMDSTLKLQREVDLWSGACNYTLISEKEGIGGELNVSVRGTGVSSIPVLSDMKETYLSQNQNSLSSALVGDVASMGVGVASSLVGGPVGIGAGASAIVSGLNGISSRNADTEDIGSKQSNPPAMLGTAMVANHSGHFWMVVTKKKVDNSSVVHGNLGYVQNMYKNAGIPDKGYLKTQGAMVSTDGTVPRWAVDEINQILNNGIRTH